MYKNVARSPPENLDRVGYCMKWRKHGRWIKPERRRTRYEEGATAGATISKLLPSCGCPEPIEGLWRERESACKSRVARASSGDRTRVFVFGFSSVPAFRNDWRVLIVTRTDRRLRSVKWLFALCFFSTGAPSLVINKPSWNCGVKGVRRVQLCATVLCRCQCALVLTSNTRAF